MVSIDTLNAIEVPELSLKAFAIQSYPESQSGEPPRSKRAYRITNVPLTWDAVEVEDLLH